MLPVCQVLTATALVQNLTAPRFWTLLSVHVVLEEAHVPPLLGCKHHKRSHQAER